MQTLKIIKCPCGDAVCSYYHIKSLGTYAQGTGHDRETAIEICYALVAKFPHKYTFPVAFINSA